MSQQKTSNYNELRNELDAILEKMQNPDVSIDEAMDLFEQGMTTIKKIEDYLEGAETKITKIKAKFDQSEA